MYRGQPRRWYHHVAYLNLNKRIVLYEHHTLWLNSTALTHVVLVPIHAVFVEARVYYLSIAHLYAHSGGTTRGMYGGKNKKVIMFTAFLQSRHHHLSI